MAESNQSTLDPDAALVRRPGGEMEEETKKPQAQEMTDAECEIWMGNGHKPPTVMEFAEHYGKVNFDVWDDLRLIHARLSAVVKEMVHNEQIVLDLNRNYTSKHNLANCWRCRLEAILGPAVRG